MQSLHERPLLRPLLLRLHRLGWVHEKIAEVVWLILNRVSEIVNNTNFGEINTLLYQGRDMDYIAKHYSMDLALGWPFWPHKAKDHTHQAEQYGPLSHLHQGIYRLVAVNPVQDAVFSSLFRMDFHIDRLKGKPVPHVFRKPINTPVIDSIARIVAVFL